MQVKIKNLAMNALHRSSKNSKNNPKYKYIQVKTRT